MKKTFKSKVDKSIVIILVASFLFSFYALFTEINQPDLYSNLLSLLNEPSESRSALLVLTLTTVFVVYIFVKVKYQVTDTQIIIHNGLFSKTIAIKEGVYPKEDYKLYRSFRRSIAKYENLRIAIIKK